MFATLVTLSLFALPAFATSFAIDTPKSLVACGSQKFTWTGGSPPYNLVIVEADSPCGDILYQFPDTNATSLTWSSVDLPTEYIGKKLTLSLEDGNEDEAWSTSILYTTGSDHTCLGGGPGASSSASGSSSSSAASAAPTTATISAEPIPLVTAVATTATASYTGAVAVGGVGNAGALGGTSGAFSVQMSGSALIAAAAFGFAALSL